MADGRAFTDYRTRCEQYPTKAAGLWGEHDARQRMIADTQEFMNATKQLLNTKMGSVGCVDTMVPELYKRVCTYKGCTVQNGHYAGLGTGRIYIPDIIYITTRYFSLEPMRSMICYSTMISLEH